jgi:ANTAR domain
MAERAAMSLAESLSAHLSCYDSPPEPGDLLAEVVRLRDENEQLKDALQSNRQIGAATGVLMAQHRLTQQQAFELLKGASQNYHRKLRDVANEVLFTGTLPSPASSDSAHEPRHARASPHGQGRPARDRQPNAGLTGRG